MPDTANDSDATKLPSPTTPPPQPAVVQTSSGSKVLLKNGLPIEASPVKPEVVGEAGQFQIKSDGSKLKLEIPEPPLPTLVETAPPKEDVNPQNPPTAAGYVQVIPNPDGLAWAKFRGVCTKCGFQSFQPTESLAQQMIQIHAGKHVMGV